MHEVKRKWKYVSIAKKVILRIKRVLGFVPDESVAEYVRHALAKRLEHDEAAFEEFKMEEEEIRARLNDR